MFSGIVAGTGRIVRSERNADGVRLVIDAGKLDLPDVALGDSIACNGVCLTVVALDGSSFAVDVSRETLDCTVGLERDGPDEINLEKALRLSDRLGGHLVSGHVDAVGEVTMFEPRGESHELRVRAPSALARYIVRKGSITIDGVSLTTNTVVHLAGDAEFSVNLIPHTLASTNLRTLQRGRRVNLEVDLIARYVERMLGNNNPST